LLIAPDRRVVTSGAAPAAGPALINDSRTAIAAPAT